MDGYSIALFAGHYLEQYKKTSVPLLQKYIRNRDEVGKYIPPEEIEQVLNDLSLAYFLEISGKDEWGNPVYKRVFPRTSGRY
jgi:hypothetical protein